MYLDNCGGSATILIAMRMHWKSFVCVAKGAFARVQKLTALPKARLSEQDYGDSTLTPALHVNVKEDCHLVS